MNDTDDKDLLGDQNMIAHDSSNGGHLYNNPQFNIWFLNVNNIG